LTYLEIILLCLVTVLLVLSTWMIRKLYSLGVTVLNVQDTVEESIEIFETRVESIEKILSIPLFSDSPEIKAIQRDMIACRDATLDIAYSLSNSMRKDTLPTDEEEL
jgi:hypothetical protein